MTKAETKTLLQLLEEVPDHREGNTINRIRFLDRLQKGNMPTQKKTLPEDKALNSIL